MLPLSSASHTQASVTCPYPELHGIRPSPRPCAIFRHTVRSLRCGTVSTSHNPQAGGPPLDRCPRLLISVFYRPQWRLFLQRSYTHIKQHKYYNFVYFNLCNFRYLPNYTAPYFLRTWLLSIKQHKYYNFVYFNLCNFRYLPNYTASYFLRTSLSIKQHK